MNTQCGSFSSLPIELVILIITYLPLRDAFRLCFARKEWWSFQLWKHCSSVEMHEVSFTGVAVRKRQLNVGQRRWANECKTIGKLRFVTFFNWLLTQIASPALSKFRFQMAYRTRDKETINRWIAFALSKTVEELSIDLSDDDPLEPISLWFTPQYKLPDFFFVHGGSVRVLSLNSCHLGLCNFLGFFRLKCLTLTRVSMLMGETISNVIITCPFLEVLVLDRCYQLIKLEICFTLSRLQKLAVRCCQPLSLGVELRLPRLQCFEYVGGLIRFHMKQLDSLKDISLEFQEDLPFLYTAREIREFISGFDQAKIFTIRTTSLKVPPYEYLFGRPLLQIINVEHLTLKSSVEPYELPALLCLLRDAPYLKTLNIFCGFTRPLSVVANYDYPELLDEFWRPLGRFLTNLKTVNVVGFTGKRYEVHLLKFILRHARMLCKVAVTPHIKGLRYLEALANLQTEMVASKSVIIELS